MQSRSPTAPTSRPAARVRKGHFTETESNYLPADRRSKTVRGVTSGRREVVTVSTATWDEGSARGRGPSEWTRRKRFTVVIVGFAMAEN